MNAMTAPPETQGVSDANALMTAAARCWRSARDTGAPVQQRLYALLSLQGVGMLAPVFDSLMTLAETALGSRFIIGGKTLSDAEKLLIDLLNGAQSRQSAVDCAEGIGVALDCAIRSTRIMLATTFARTLTRAPTTPPFVRRFAAG